jgi:hypothetical protein
VGGAHKSCDIRPRLAGVRDIHTTVSTVYPQLPVYIRLRCGGVSLCTLETVSVASRTGTLKNYSPGYHPCSALGFTKAAPWVGDNMGRSKEFLLRSSTSRLPPPPPHQHHTPAPAIFTMILRKYTVAHISFLAHGRAIFRQSRSLYVQNVRGPCRATHLNFLPVGLAM